MIILSEYAFAKLSWFRVNCTDDNIQNVVTKSPQFLEVSLMGISESENNLGHIVDFKCVPQECSGGLTEPDDDGMNTYLESMLIDEGISIIRCGRFWAHTHPGTSPTPSSTDDETFAKWFGHSDLGVMYILAKGDDSCKVKHGSKYFGINVENMPVYVELERVDNNKNKILLSTKTLFAIDKIGNSDAYESIHAVMFNDYSDMEEIWMTELRANVKKKYHYQNTGHYQNVNGISYGVNNYKPTNQNLIQHSISGTGQQTNIDKPLEKIKISNVISLLTYANKNSINEFSKEEKSKILDHFKITMGELQGKYNELLNHEKSFNHFELQGYEADFIDDNGKSKFDQIKKPQLIEFCKTFCVRPLHLKNTIEAYIAKANAVIFTP